MPKRREIPQPQKKICPQDGAQYEDFCMAYGCENQDGSGGCKAVQKRYCKYQNGDLVCDGKCNTCGLSDGLNPDYKPREKPQ